jgi:hypothetical protein
MAAESGDLQRSLEVEDAELAESFMGRFGVLPKIETLATCMQKKAACIFLN